MICIAERGATFGRKQAGLSGLFYSETRMNGFCQNHPITAVVDGDWSVLGVT
jgi:hypothetical protein